MSDRVSEMQPSVGDTMLSLPMTFDYNAGRSESKKTRMVWAVVLSVGALFISALIAFGKAEQSFKIVAIPAILVLTSLFVRFYSFSEKKVRAEITKVLKNDYKMPERTLWGIYGIDNSYPYVCHFENGRSGVFVALVKDVILGKHKESEFDHYEAISDAYNFAGGSGIQMCHIDYMDAIGSDERIEYSFDTLSGISNPDLRDLLMSVFSYQRDLMMSQVTSFDVYLFTWRGSSANNWIVVQKVLACFLDANYRSYRVLDAEGIKDLVAVLFNLQEFSVVDAEASMFEIKSDDTSGVTAISLEYENGEVVKLGKTLEERLQDAEAEKKSKKSGKESKSSDAEEEELDIF